MAKGRCTKMNYISSMNLKEAINDKRPDFLALYKANNGKNLYAFGSSITDQSNQDARYIDLMIEIDNHKERGESIMNIGGFTDHCFNRKPNP